MTPLISGTMEIFGFWQIFIPLTKKLKECGVSGVSSDEYIKYASANREEWSVVGEAVVEEWRKVCQSTIKAEKMITLTLRFRGTKST